MEALWLNSHKYVLWVCHIHAHIYAMHVGECDTVCVGTSMAACLPSYCVGACMLT